MIDLRNVGGPVTLSFNHNLTAASGTTTLASADPTTVPLGTWEAWRLHAQNQAPPTSARFRWTRHPDRSLSNLQPLLRREMPAAAASYAGSAVGTATSPIIDLAGVTGKVTLNMTYFLNAAGRAIFGATVTVQVVYPRHRHRRHSDVIANNAGTKSRP